MPDELISSSSEEEVPYDRIAVINELADEKIQSLADLEVMSDDDLIDLYNDTFAPDDSDDDSQEGPESDDDDDDDPDKPVECCYCGEIKICEAEDQDRDPICDACLNDPGDDDDVENGDDIEEIDEETETDEDDIDNEEDEA